MLGLRNSCNTCSNIKICNQKDLIDLRENDCILKLMLGKNAKCDYSNADPIESLEEIQEDIILLNNFQGRIKWEDTDQIVQGI